MSHSDKPFLKLEGVGVRYKISNRLFSKDYQWPLKDISFEVYPGETVGIISRNGAGKSTLMRLMAGIIEPDRGVIESQDISILLLTIQVGFQAHLSGRDNALQSGMLFVRQDVTFSIIAFYHGFICTKSYFFYIYQI